VKIVSLFVQNIPRVFNSTKKEYIFSVPEPNT